MRTVCGVENGTPCSEKLSPEAARAGKARHSSSHRDDQPHPDIRCPGIAKSKPWRFPAATVEVECRTREPARTGPAKVNQPQHTKATRPEAQHRSPLRVPGYCAAALSAAPGRPAWAARQPQPGGPHAVAGPGNHTRTDRGPAAQLSPAIAAGIRCHRKERHPGPHCQVGRGDRDPPLDLKFRKSQQRSSDLRIANLNSCFARARHSFSKATA